MLHIINKSPAHSSALTTCLRFVAEHDVILLIEDGVYAALANNDTTPSLPTDKATIYVLKEDVYARGIANRLNSNIKLVDYAGFADLTIAHHPAQTWS